jgi:glucosylceramidase
MPLVEQAQQLNPAATVVASSWSAPAWMKSGGSLIGGTLKPQFYDAYAQYLADAIHDYLAAGVRVGGLTLQNEPSFSRPGYAGMTLSPDQQRHLVKRLRLALDRAAANRVSIWALDDNYDRVGDAEHLVSDAEVRSRIGGLAFHRHRGDAAAMRGFHARHPEVPLAISECTGRRLVTDLRGESAPRRGGARGHRDRCFPQS